MYRVKLFVYHKHIIFLFVLRTSEFDWFNIIFDDDDDDPNQLLFSQ